MDNEDRRIAGRYRLLERIGVGSMGIVWRGLDEKLRRAVAVKQLSPPPGLAAGASREACERARREARVAARLQHPNVVTVYDVVEEDSLPWLIMEYVPADSLAAALARRGPLPLPEVTSIGAQIAAALAAAHQVGVVHRDVKPGNVLLTEDGTAKLADFGISRAVGDVVLTATGLVFGTPAYLAPEVANGATPTTASDVFALGATLYAATEGQPPFGLSDNPLALLHAVAHGRIVPPTHTGPLIDVLESLLRNDPDARPRSGDVAATLAALDRSGTAAPAPPHSPATPATTTAPPAVVGSDVTAEIHGPRPRTGKVHKGSLVPVRTAALATIGILTALAITAGVMDMMGGHDSAAPAGAVPTPHSVTTVPPGTSSAQPGATDVRGFITQYYALLPGHLTAAWRLLSPTYQAKVGGFGAFKGFYETIASVQVVAVSVADGHTATATLVFTRKDGTTSVEAYRFTVSRRGTSFIVEDANPAPRDVVVTSSRLDH